MIKKFFLRLDADGVGDAIELALLGGEFEKAQNIHLKIQNELKKTIELINAIPSSEILMYGSDDILFTLDKSLFNIEEIENLKSTFFISTKFTLSIAIGSSTERAMLNLNKPKLRGKNRIELEE